MSFYKYFDQIIFILSLVSMLYIPLKKHYKIDHFSDILKIKYINLYDTDNNINMKDNSIIISDNTVDIFVRYISNIEKLSNSLSKYKSLYIAIIFFVTVLLLYSLMFLFIFPKYDIYDHSKNTKYFIITNSIEILISFIIWIMALPNIFKINKIAKELDFNHIGLTIEIKYRLLIIIFMMSFNILLIIFKFIYFYYSKNYIDINKDRKPQNIQISNKHLERKYKIDESEKSLKSKNETNRKLKNKKDIITEYEEDKKGEKDKEIKNQKYSLLKTENEKLKNRINQLEEISKSKDEKILKLEQDLEKFKSYYSTSEKELISLSIILGDQSIEKFNIVSKDSDIFTTLENKIYEKNPNLRENENFFLFNGKKINKNKTLKDNNIKDNSVITLYKFDENDDNN